MKNREAGAVLEEPQLRLLWRSPSGEALPNTLLHYYKNDFRKHTSFIFETGRTVTCLIKYLMISGDGSFIYGDNVKLDLRKQDRLFSEADFLIGPS